MGCEPQNPLDQRHPTRRDGGKWEEYLAPRSLAYPVEARHLPGVFRRNTILPMGGQAPPAGRIGPILSEEAP